MNNQNDDILSRIFRNRLKDYKEQPDADLWSKIEADLQKSNPRKKTAVWKWIGTVAAAALLIGMIKFATVEEKKPITTAANESTPTKQNSVQTDKIKTTVDNEQISTPVATDINTTKNLLSHNIKPINKQFNRETGIEKNPEIPAESTQEKPISTAEKTEKKPVTEIKPTDNSANKTEKENAMPLVADTSPEEWNISQKDKASENKGLSLALAMGNSTTGFSGANEDASFFSGQYASELKLDALAPQYEDITSNRIPEYITSDVDYSRPITVGFYVRKHFSKHWAIESGLSYTYLESKETQTATNRPTIDKETSLNYIGIPVKAVYSFVNNNRLSIYTSGGAMAEKCVYGKEKIIPSGDTESLSIPEIQCSVSGAVGINYRLVSHLCLFVEPGVSYYFDSKSDVNTIRKDTPLSLELQGGIRLVY